MEETINVVDKDSEKRSIGRLNAGIPIQDLGFSEDMVVVDIVHLTEEEGDRTLERVIIRVKDDTGDTVLRGEYTWDLTTSRSKSKRKEKLEGTPA